MAKIEVWKPVIGYKKLYSVSSLGRIRRDGKAMCGTWPGRILKGQKRGKGRYLNVTLLGNSISVASIVARAFIGRKPRKLQINHKDGDRLNNCKGNLEYVTASENIKHAYRIGLK